MSVYVHMPGIPAGSGSPIGGATDWYFGLRTDGARFSTIGGVPPSPEPLDIPPEPPPPGVVLPAPPLVGDDVEPAPPLVLPVVLLPLLLLVLPPGLG